MKKYLLLLSTLALMPFATIHAEVPIETRIKDLQSEISDRQIELADLENQLYAEDEFVEFEHEGLKFKLMIESKDSIGTFTNDSETFLFLHIEAENMTDSALAFDPDNFNLYLAEIGQAPTKLMGTSMEEQAVPGGTTVKGTFHYGLTNAVLNAKDLVMRYEPSDDIFIGETIFEFKVNDLKRIETNDAGEIAKAIEDKPEQVAKEESTTKPVKNAEDEADHYAHSVPIAGEMKQEEVYDYIEDAYYADEAINYEELYYQEGESNPEYHDLAGYSDYNGSLPYVEVDLRDIVDAVEGE